MAARIQDKISRSVVIIGAGPAGLVLGNILRAHDIECLILERAGRAQLESRGRAGFLAANTVRVLTENGLADGLLRSGKPHSTCEFRYGGQNFTLDYGGLGRGEIHTVYPQQFLIKDLAATFIERGGEILFDTTVKRIDGLESGAAVVVAEGEDGREIHCAGRFVAGCDGRHGVGRRSVPPGRLQILHRDHGVSWLALLVAAPPSTETVTYAIHPDGMAGHMARTASVTRYYLQCLPGDDPNEWSDERIWNQLDDRMMTDSFGALRKGDVLERGVVHLQSDVLSSLRYRRLFLAGDAASLISPSAAKGANLAVMESEILAAGLIASLRYGDDQPLARYSDECLPRIWRAQEFSHWMIHLLHGPSDESGDSRFLHELQKARLGMLQSSRSFQDFFAENYVGI